jgi:hypothetical protein
MPAPGRQSGMDTIPVSASIIEIEPIEVSRRLPGWKGDWRILLSGGLIAAVVGLGAIGSGSAGPSPARAGVSVVGAVSDRVITGPTAAGEMSGPGPSTPGLAISSPAEDELVRGPTVTVRGTADHPIGPVTISIRLGSATLGSTVAVIGPGPFSKAIPVFSPLVPLTVGLAIEGDPATTAPLATRSFRLAARSAVEAWSIASVAPAATCRTMATGFAPLTTGSLRATVRVTGSVLGSAVAPVRLDEALDGGRLVGLGRWRVEVEGAFRVPALGPGWLQLDWRDPSDGSQGTLSAPLPACPDRPRAPGR